MINKKLILLIVGISLIGLAIGGLSPSSFDGDIDLTRTQIDRIKESSSVDKIEISTSQVECNDVECYSFVNQDKVLNDVRWSRESSHCSREGIVYDDDGNDIDRECLEYTDYTVGENKQALEDFVNQRLAQYSNAETERHRDKNSVIVLEGGFISEGK